MVIPRVEVVMVTEANLRPGNYLVPGEMAEVGMDANLRPRNYYDEYSRPAVISLKYYPEWYGIAERDP